MVPLADWAIINQQKVQQGMTMCEVLAAFGSPDHVNRTVGPSGILVQLVFGDPLTSVQYVYLADGRVSSFESQN